MQLNHTLYDRQLYQKSYLIEFYGTKEEPDTVFTFSVPPESEELTYSQRKTETKTFGGLHVDEYGTDAVRITLSGSTVNQSLKRIYTADKRQDMWLTGEDEIYHFRKLILEHKKIDKLIEKSNTRKVLIYDLSKFTGLRSSESDIPNIWQAFIGDFKIRRASDRPFTYKYTFEFTGVPCDRVTPRVQPIGSKSLPILKKTLDILKDMVDYIYNAQALLDDALGYVKQVNDLLYVLGDVMSNPEKVITESMKAVGGAVLGGVKAAENIKSGGESLINLPRTINQNYLSIKTDLQNAINRLNRSTTSFSSTCRDFLDDENTDIPTEILKQYGMNNEEYKDYVKTLLNDAENAANDIVVYSKSSEIPDVVVGNTDPVTGNPQIVLAYGYTNITVKDTDTFETLAMQYFGDPDRAADIATYNNVVSIDNLNPGDVLRLPVTTRNENIANNQIYARQEDQNNYGRDIMLTDEGNIVVSKYGDYQLLEGVDNLNQAILLRLRENNAKRIRINAYGIRTGINDQTAAVAYITSSVRLTINSEPRVSNVDKVRFRAAGDVLNVEADYRDINNIESRVKGRA